jgi:hypothetical protein
VPIQATDATSLDRIGPPVLHALNQSLETFLRTDVPLPPAEVDITFATPDKEWSSRLIRPTVNLFLHEIRRSSSRSVAGMVTRVGTSSASREVLAPFVRVRWLISAWTAESDDEHRLLGDVLSLVAVAGSLPKIHLVEPLGSIGNPVELALATEDARPAVEMWSALGQPPRASVELVGVLPVMPPYVKDVPMPPTDVGIGVSDTNEPSRASHLGATQAAPGAPLGPGRRLGHGRAAVEEV